MKKLLIYKNKRELAPVGGPRGYLYNLKCGLEKIENKKIQIDFLDYELNVKKQSSIKKIVKIFLPKSIKEMRLNKNIDNFIRESLDGNSQLPINYREYDYIHFHSTFDLYRERNNLKNFNGKVILTSHSPQPYHQEFIELFNIENHPKGKEYKKELENVDIFSFSRSDYIIFPCKEAEEPYYNRWSKYKKIHSTNKKKYKYLLSGIKKCKSIISKKDIREKYNIPSDAYLISYVGRHNDIKGYDILKEIGKEILQKNNNLYIIIAGKEGPIYRLDNSKWIEVGWTNDPHSIISASDLFVLPNKETYFDLIFLEVLSLGIPLLVSNTGGNKHFKKYDESDIYFFDNVTNAIKKINVLKNKKVNTNKNKKIFDKYFNDKIFAKNYIELINNLEGK